MEGNETMTEKYTWEVVDHDPMFYENKEGIDWDDVVDLLNEQDQRIKELEEEIARQKYTKGIMRDNIKDYERAIKRLRKSYEEFDEMRLERIRFLEKRLKKNGLSIYVNDCWDLDD